MNTFITAVLALVFIMMLRNVTSFHHYHLCSGFSLGFHPPENPFFEFGKILTMELQTSPGWWLVFDIDVIASLL